jgi:protein-tyrosine phosphatase
MGNICRSPAAEMVFRKLAADSGRANEFLIDSAGTISYHQGAPPDPRMAKTLMGHGYPVSGTARRITPEDLEQFDLILTMDEDNYAEVRRMDTKGLHSWKIRPFVDFCMESREVRIPDPYYGGQKGFNHVVRLLEDGCQGILASIGLQRSVA